MPENSQDVVLATLGAVDPDAEQQHTYTVQGTALFYTAGDKLQVNEGIELCRRSVLVTQTRPAQLCRAGHRLSTMAVNQSVSCLVFPALIRNNAICCKRH